MTKRLAIASLIGFCAFLLLATISFATPVPDTGQTQCYNNTSAINCPLEGQPFYGQDSNYTINTHSYTNLSNGIVRDNVTGLEWVKDGNLMAHRDPGFDNDGTIRDGVVTWQHALDYVAKLNTDVYLGHNDWRLPTVKELSTLVDSDIPYPGPTIDTTFFPGTQTTAAYWSSTIFAFNTDGAWDVSFSVGYVGPAYKTFYRYVRAVRGRPLSENSFIYNGDSTVSDTSTGLMWQQATAPGTYSWEQALAYCENLILNNDNDWTSGTPNASGAKYSDWRLPNINELQSIVDYSLTNPPINYTYFPGTVAADYWSSNTFAYDTDSAFIVAFNYGIINKYVKTNGYYVRAVRGGQCGTFGDSDGDGICDDGDVNGVVGETPCTGGNTVFCDDNCPSVSNLSQEDSNNDGRGDACNIVYVYSESTCTSGCGGSWAAPFKTIQAAVDAAVDGQEIWVKAGPLPYSLSSEIVVNKAIGIYGGFAGTETQRDERNWAKNKTRIDGNHAFRCLNITGDATIDGFTITGGSVSGSFSSGAGILNNSGNSVIANCIITDNHVSGTSGAGGGIYDGGAATVKNCVISNNSVNTTAGLYSIGGGIYGEGTTIINCTVVGNSQQGTGEIAGGGGLMANVNGTVVNSIVWGNTAEGQYDQIWSGAPVSTSVTYSDIDQDGYGNSGGSADSNGNIRRNPLFVDTATGNYRLLIGSPCIDAGTSENAPLTDLDGKPRFDVPNTGGSSYDIGAFEYVDTDNDGVPDDGDNNGIPGDHPCTGGIKTNCDDNCPAVENPNQDDADGDGIGDACETITTTSSSSTSSSTTTTASVPNAWSSMPSGTKQLLKSVWGSSDTDVFAVGTPGTIRHYNGTDWSAMTIPTTQYLSGVWGNSGTDVFAVGQYYEQYYDEVSGSWKWRWSGSVFRSNGTSWTAMTIDPPVPKPLYGVWGSSDTDVFAVGDNGTILHYNGPGTNWTAMTIQPSISKPLYGVWGSSATDVFAVGGGGTILHYNGSAWTAITLDPPISMTLHGVWGSAYNNVFAVGTAGTILYYNGITWSSITLDPPISMTLYGIWGSSATDVFVVGAYGTILHYDGTAWSAMPSGTTMGLTGVWGSSEDDVFAAGYGGTVLHYGAAGTPSSSTTSSTTPPTGRTFYISNSILGSDSNDGLTPDTPLKHIPTLMKDVKLYCNDPNAKLYRGSYVIQNEDKFILRRGDRWEGVYLQAYPDDPTNNMCNLSNITLTSEPGFASTGNSAVLPQLYGCVNATEWGLDWVQVSSNPNIFKKKFTNPRGIKKAGIWKSNGTNFTALTWEETNTPAGDNHWYWNQDLTSEDYDTVFIKVPGTTPPADIYIATENYGITAAGDNWTIDNLDLGYYNVAIVPKKEGSNEKANGTIIRNCKIHDSECNYRESPTLLWSYGQGILCGAGIQQNYTGNEIYNISTSNTIRDMASAHGIYVGYHFEDSVISFNHIYNCLAGSGIHVYSDYPNPKYALSTNVKIYGNVLEHNYIGSFFRECASCLFANNTIVNCYPPPGYSNPTGLNIFNVPGSIIVNNLFYNPAIEPATGANTPYDINFCNFSLDMPGVVFDYNYYTRVNQGQVTIRLASPYVPNPYNALWYNLFAAGWDSYRSTFPDLDTTSRADVNFPFNTSFTTSPPKWAIAQGSWPTNKGFDISPYTGTNMVLLDPNSIFPITATAGSGHKNIGAYIDVVTGGSGNMYSGTYNELLSPMKTSAFPSSPATGEGATSYILQSSEADQPQSGYFYYTESGGTITITGYKTNIGSYPVGPAVIPSTINDKQVVGIGEYAFAYNSFLTSVSIPTSVMSIGVGAFAFCSGLTSVSIPASVASIGIGAFVGCSGMTSIVVDAGNTVYSSQVGVLYKLNNNSPTELIQYPAGKSGGFDIPDSVTSIAPYAFAYCPGLTSVSIPSSVTSIGKEAFRNCSGLNSMNIPDTVTSIGNSVFCGCSGLTSVTIPAGVMGIGQDAFYGCSGLTSVTIPASVTSIGNWAFTHCSSLTSAYFLGDAPLTVGSAIFDNCAIDFTIYYTAGSTGFTDSWNVYHTEEFQGCAGINDPWPADGSGTELNLYQIFNQTFNQQLTSSDQLSSLYGLADNLDDWWLSINQSGEVEFTVRYAGFDQELGILPLNGTYQPLVTNIPPGKQNTSVVINTSAQFAFVETSSGSVWYSVESMNPIQDGDHFKAFDVTDLYNSTFSANVSQAWLIAFEDTPTDQGSDCDYSDLVALVTEVEPTSLIDSDGDGIPDTTDNCPTVCNPQQLDADGDKIGDVCDTDPGCGGCSGKQCEQPCPASSTTTSILTTTSSTSSTTTSVMPTTSSTTTTSIPDTDGDGIPDNIDNCPTNCNSQQLDADGDKIGDVCDTDPGCGGCSGIQCEQQC